MATGKTGWVGIGTMGRPMAMRLLEAGYELMVFNRTREKEQPLLEAGAQSASSPAALASICDTIVIMVTDDQACRDLFQGEQGLLTMAASGKVFINMSTISPELGKELHGLCKERKCDYLDAPVSGSVKQATEGQLVIMAGGAETLLEKVRPLLEVLGKLVLHVGSAGNGNAAKLAVNTLLAIYTQGLAEAVTLATANGIRAEDFLTLINNGALSNAYTKIKGEAIVNQQYKPAFALRHMVKDLTLAQAMGLNSPVGNVVADSFRKAAVSWSDEDLIAIYKYIQTTA